MTKFYFHILNGGTVIPDDEGMELGGFLAAQAEAMASARDLARSADGNRRIIQIADASGMILDCVPVFMH